MRQLVAFAPPATETRSYAGDYRSVEIGVTCTLEARDSTLVVTTTGRPDVTIALFSLAGGSQIPHRHQINVEGNAPAYLLIDGRWEDHVLTAITNPIHSVFFIWPSPPL